MSCRTYCDKLLEMDTFKSIIDKIAEGLNFFDFSFFVSGFVTYITLLYFSDEFLGKTIDYTSVTGILASIVLSYVCGIISFSLGKLIRSIVLWLFHWDCLGKLKDRSFDELFQECIDWAIANKQRKTPDASIVDLPGQLALSETKQISYSAMWIEIRKLDEKDVYYRPLYRQWVMQAICEGLVFSFMLIFVLSLVVLKIKGCMPLYINGSIVSFVAFAASCHEARRYAENQIKEVIISFYFLKNQEQ